MGVELEIVQAANEEIDALKEHIELLLNNQKGLRHALLGVCQDNLNIAPVRMEQINCALDNDERIQNEATAK